jgi:hypothetical protein
VPGHRGSSMRPSFNGGHTVRDLLQRQGFEGQYMFGQDVLNIVLQGKALP